MRSASNFGDLLLDRRPSHFVPPEMRDRGILHRGSARGALLDAVVLRNHVAGGRAPPPGTRKLQGVVNAGGDNHRRTAPLGDSTDSESRRFRLERGALRCLGGQD